MFGSRATKRGDQVPTRPTMAREIMNSPWFALGVADARANPNYPPGYDDWKETNDQWCYEHVRFWG
jgi:hypothetical protein